MPVSKTEFCLSSKKLWCTKLGWKGRSFGWADGNFAFFGWCSENLPAETAQAVSVRRESRRFEMDENGAAPQTNGEDEEDYPDDCVPPAQLTHLRSGGGVRGRGDKRLGWTLWGRVASLPRVICGDFRSAGYLDFCFQPKGDIVGCELPTSHPGIHICSLVLRPLRCGQMPQLLLGRLCSSNLMTGSTTNTMECALGKASPWMVCQAHG